MELFQLYLYIPLPYTSAFILTYTKSIRGELVLGQTVTGQKYLHSPFYTCTTYFFYIFTISLMIFITDDSSLIPIQRTDSRTGEY